LYKINNPMVIKNRESLLFISGCNKYNMLHYLKITEKTVLSIGENIQNLCRQL
jgi:hypothetical protein